MRWHEHVCSQFRCLLEPTVQRFVSRLNQLVGALPRIICILNTICIAIQFMVAKEELPAHGAKPSKYLENLWNKIILYHTTINYIQLATYVAVVIRPVLDCGSLICQCSVLTPWPRKGAWRGCRRQCQEPLKRVEGEKANCCSPVVSVFKSLRGTLAEINEQSSAANFAWPF